MSTFVTLKKVKSDFLILIRLILLSGLFLSGCKVDLYSDLSEKQANEVLYTLEKQGIPAKKKLIDERKHLFGIEVEKNDASRAVEVLRSFNVPSSKRQGFSGIGGDGFIPSPEKQLLKYYVALSEELEITLEKLPGIKMARVHIAVPPPTGISVFDKKNVSASRASVILGIDEKKFKLKPSDIQTLVAGAVSDISTDNIVVIIQSLPSPSSISSIKSDTFFNWMFIFPAFLIVLYAFIMTLLWIKAKKRIKIETGE